MNQSLPYRILYSVGDETCKKCRQQISIGDLQIAIMVQSNVDDCKYPLWYHRECFFKVRLPGTEAAFDGFAQLRYAHQMVMRKDLSIDESGNKSGTTDNGLMNRLRIQNEEYFRIYDYILANVPQVHRTKILAANGQAVPSTSTQVVHHLTDVIYFGALPVCEKCGKGQLIFINWAYKCTYETEWSGCDNEVNEPTRKLIKFPTELLTKYTFLEEQCGVRTRALQQFRMFDEQGNDIVYGPYKRPPLFNMELVLIGDDFSKSRSDIERLIKKLGGKVGQKVHERVAAIISTANEVHEMNKQMADAELCGIEVVTEKFLKEVQNNDVDPIGYIISENISDWCSNPYDRIADNDVATRLEAAFHENESLPENVTYKWRGGYAVDPECGLVDNVHVYSTNINGKRFYYSVILGFVDIQSNKNSYYRLQLLESNVQKIYWVFESWGRIGTTIGSKKLQTFPTFRDAFVRFNSVFESKTANKFVSRTFNKQPNKFYHLDVEMKLEGMSKKMLKKYDASKLDKPVHDLMQMLFDTTKVKNTMVGCDLNLKKMPLGKITTNQIKMAMSTLQTIEQLIQQNGSIHDLRGASNKFYTFVPHAFAINRPPIIDSIETLTEKQEMLESLLNMEVIYSFLGDENGGKSHPLDVCYRKLKTSIVPIAKDSDEFRLFCDIVRNTHSSKHNEFTLKVLEIFKVERDGEADRFDWKLRNHELLWHGSSIINFANILSNGLKAAPQEALEHTRRAFGNGIYFTDIITKAAEFCYPDPTSNIGMMLLCDVALGIPRVMTTRSKVVDIPNEENQSIKALGRFVPCEYRQIDGVNLASRGKFDSSKELTHNEFIVFDPSQIKIKYLFNMKFHCSHH